MPTFLDGHQKIEMYKRFRGITSLEEVEELQEEMLDRFGEYPDEVAYLLLIAEMKVYAEKAGIESIKQLKQEITILISEKVSSDMDGQKVFELGSKYGRMVGLGMDGNRMKLVLHIKRHRTSKWLNILFETGEGLAACKKRESSNKE